MNSVARGLSVAYFCVFLGSGALGQPVAYTDETAFLIALANQGYIPVAEGFEDDAAWGSVRTQTAPSVANLGITWSSSSANNDITTGTGPARTGTWGFYSLPHGDYANGITDGWHGVADQPLVAIGGWIDTNTVPAGISLYLDGNAQNPVDFGGASALTGAYQFFGVIDPAGFSAFDFRETEGTIGDQKLIFADDFTFALGGVILDCNENGLADGLDIRTGASGDCNRNIVPDECEIDANSTAPGGPFHCTAACASDCNDNGTLDECEAVTADVYASGPLSPIGFASPQSFTIVSAPVTRADVVLNFTAYAILGGAGDVVSVDINGVPVGTVFGPNGSDCPNLAPDVAQLLVPKGTFNSAVGGGDAVINMVASTEVDPNGCDLPTYITVEAELFIPSAADADGDGVLDVCASAIPTISAWGVIATVLMLMVAGTILLEGNRTATRARGAS